MGEDSGASKHVPSVEFFRSGTRYQLSAAFKLEWDCYDRENSWEENALNLTRYLSLEPGLLDKIKSRPHIWSMKLVNISQAKTHLSSLIEAAEQGEEVMILRGSRPAVTLVKVTEDDLHFHPEIPVRALQEFDSEIERDKKEGALVFLGNIGSQAVDALNRG